MRLLCVVWEVVVWNGFRVGCVEWLDLIEVGAPSRPLFFKWKPPPTKFQPYSTHFTHSEHEAGWALLNHELEDGRSWPFESSLSLDGFRAYFLSHAAFVVRTVKAEEETEGDGDRVLGAFYIKPNFPGRCAHICNGGFITRVAVGRGVVVISSSVSPCNPNPIRPPYTHAMTPHTTLTQPTKQTNTRTQYTIHNRRATAGWAR